MLLLRNNLTSILHQAHAPAPSPRHSVLFATDNWEFTEAAAPPAGDPICEPNSSFNNLLDKYVTLLETFDRNASRD